MRLPYKFTPGAMLLLTDGSVIVQDIGRAPNDNGTSNWWRLTPDSRDSYIDGTWTKIAPMPAGYAPNYYASAVLPDGRVIVEGGEYDGSSQPVWTTQGAIYDPVANTWTPVAPPGGWDKIGDAPSTILAGGRFMVGSCDTYDDALLRPSTLTWQFTGTGKADENGEEGWALLPNGQVLTVDTKDKGNTELYSPSTGAWTSAGTTPNLLVDARGEIGPELMLPTGQLFAVGATGATDLYDTATATWSAGPSLPTVDGQQLDEADGPAAVLPDGDVLLGASPGDFHPPESFFLFNGTGYIPVEPAPSSSVWSTNATYMLVLPDGQILYKNDNYLSIYTAGGTPQPSWRPDITKIPTNLRPGSTYTVSGRQLNGLTQGSGYGDDYQSATNYPLVRITNAATGHETYARTTGMTSMAVTPNLASSANFTVASGTEIGLSSLVVVANGIASSPVTVTVNG